MNKIFGIYDFSRQAMTLSDHHKCENLTIVATARLDNRTFLLKKLCHQMPAESQCDDQTIILAAYQHWGEHCVQHLQGTFIFAIWDGNQQTLFCARDRMGTIPFFYFKVGKEFAFANSMAALLQVLKHQLTPNPLWIADHLCGIWLENGHTSYKEVARLPPAHTLTVFQNGIRTARYWDFDLDAETRLPSDEAYVEASRDLLMSAVKRCLTASDAVGIELSGGLDSTTIAAFAQAVCKNNPSLRLSTYSHASPIGMIGKQGFSKDEREHIDLVRAFVGIETSHFFTNEQATVMPMIDRAIRMGGGTYRCTFTMLTSGIHAMAAEQGVQVMLSGWGGDEIVSSRLPPHRYLLRAGLRQPRLLQHLWRELNAETNNSFQHASYRLLKLFWQEFLPYSPLTPQQKNQSIRFNQRNKHVNDLLEASPLLQDYISDVDWRERLVHWWEVKNIPPKSLREAQYQRISRPWLTNRLEATAQMAATFGIEYRYPLLDVELMSFFLSLPMEQKWRKGYGRYLFRQSTADLLPQEFRWKKKVPGDLYPWYMHSLKNDLAQNISPVSKNAPEEIKVNQLIAQSKRIVRRKYLKKD